MHLERGEPALRLRRPPAGLLRPLSPCLALVFLDGLALPRSYILIVWTCEVRTQLNERTSCEYCVVTKKVLVFRRWWTTVSLIELEYTVISLVELDAGKRSTSFMAPRDNS